MKRRIFLPALAAAVAALATCSAGSNTQKAAPTVDRDTLTRRQKDSIVSTMPLPGASRIGDAQKAVDRINERTRRLDSIR